MNKKREGLNVLVYFSQGLNPALVFLKDEIESCDLSGTKMSLDSKINNNNNPSSVLTKK
jgi:hypothetical protein